MEQLLDRHLLACILAIPREVLRNGSVQTKLAQGYLLQGQHRRELLGNRRDAESGLHNIRSVQLHVRIANSPGVEDLLVLCDQHGAVEITALLIVEDQLMDSSVSRPLAAQALVQANRPNANPAPPRMCFTAKSQITREALARNRRLLQPLNEAVRITCVKSGINSVNHKLRSPIVIIWA